MRLKNDSLSNSDWERIQKNLGLDPEIRTKEQYLEKVEEGIGRAKELLRKDPQLSFNASTIRNLHYEIFSELYPPEAEMAGEYTKVQLKITGPSKDDFVAGSQVHKIEPNLDNLHKVFTQRFAEAQSQDQKIQTCIDYHVQFKGIQSFPDGNGRAASVVLEHQLSLCLNREIVLNLEGNEYRDAMWLALKEGNQGPLSTLIKMEVQNQLKQSSAQTRDMEDTRTPAQQLSQEMVFDRAETTEFISTPQTSTPHVRVQSNEWAKTVETERVKQKAVVDRVFLETIVLGGAGDALTKTYQVVVPESVAHAISSRNALAEVREWLTQALQNPASGVTTEVPQNPVPNTMRLLRGSRDAMQLVRENPGSVLLTGARWGMDEAMKNDIPFQEPNDFVRQATLSGMINADTMVDKLWNRQEHRLISPIAQIYIVAECIEEERNFNVVKELECLRDEVEQWYTLSDFENSLKESPETIHGLNRNELLTEFQTSKDQDKTMRETEAKLRVAAGVERGAKALEPLLEELRQGQIKSQTVDTQNQDWSNTSMVQKIK